MPPTQWAPQATVRIAREAGIRGLRVTAVLGDDVLDQLEAIVPYEGHEQNTTRTSVQGPLAANAYFGASPIFDALDSGADIVLTGRASDPALFLAAMSHRFRCDWQDWVRLGRGTALGHLLECGGQLTGGYLADPGRFEVPGAARLGFPFAEIDADGNAVFLEGPRFGRIGHSRYLQAAVAV